MTNLVSGQPELFIVQFHDADGELCTHIHHTFQTADKHRRELQNMKPFSEHGLTVRPPKGPVRIARFRGEWL